MRNLALRGSAEGLTRPLEVFGGRSELASALYGLRGDLGTLREGLWKWSVGKMQIQPVSNSKESKSTGGMDLGFCNAVRDWTIATADGMIAKARPPLILPLLQANH